MIRTRFTPSLLAVLCATACGARAVNLDRTERAPSTPDPSSVVVSEEVMGVWVDDQRLYWRGSRIFHSCSKADCDHTTLSYSVIGDGPAAAIVADQRLYWTTVNLTTSGLFSCGADDGCASGPVMVVQDPALRHSIFANRRYIYWSSDLDIYRCPTTGCAATPEILARRAKTDYMAFDEVRAYWLGASAILSAPADGSELPRLEVTLSETSDWTRALAVGGGYLYWAVGGRAFRCPIGSCGDGTVTTLVTDGDSITGLKVYEETLYWLDADSLRSCSLPDCKQPTVVVSEKIGRVSVFQESSRFAVDASNIYWLRTSDSVSFGGSAIRRTAK